jgi:hypothetical protein
MRLQPLQSTETKKRGTFVQECYSFSPQKASVIIWLRITILAAVVAIIAVLVRVRVSIVIMQVWQDLVGKDEVADHDVGENRFRPGCDPQ